MRGTHLCQKSQPTVLLSSTYRQLGPQRAPETRGSQSKIQGVESKLAELLLVPGVDGLTALSLAESQSRLSCRHQASDLRKGEGWMRGVPGWSVSFPGQCFLKALILSG